MKQKYYIPALGLFVLLCTLTLGFVYIQKTQTPQDTTKNTATLNEQNFIQQEPTTVETAPTSSTATKKQENIITSLTIDTPDWAKTEYTLDSSISYITEDGFSDACKSNQLFTHPRTRRTISNYTYVTFGDLKIKVPYRDEEYGKNIYQAPSKTMTEVSGYNFIRTAEAAITFGDWLFIAEGASPDTCVIPRYKYQMARYEKNDTTTIENILPKDPYGKMYIEIINGITSYISLTVGLYEVSYIAFEHNNYIYILMAELDGADPGKVSESKEIISQLELL